MSITVNYIFENFQKVNGIFCDEFATKKRVFYLYGDDMMFWSIVYNKLDVDRDYDFYVFLCQKNCFNTTLKISERTFLELMETMTQTYNWKNNALNIDIPENENKRLHKLFDMAI